MKTSTATSVFVNYPIQDALDLIIQAGFEGVDFWCGRPHIYRHDQSPAALQQLRQKIDESKITPVSLMPAFFRYPYSLSSPNEVIRQDSIAYVRDCIDNAVVLGARQVLIVPTHSLHGQATADARRRYLDSLAELSSHAEQNNVRLGLEVLYPNLSDYMGSTEDALRAIQAVGSGCLGIVLDSGHLNLSGEDPEGALRNVGDLLLQVHVNDNDGLQQQNAIPGEGSFDFSKLMHLLRSYHYDGFLSLELGWTYSFDPYPAICAARDRVTGYIHAAS
jgi:sugar phosphate isomerase/epimerase